MEQRFTPESLERLSKVFMGALANEEAGLEQPNNIDIVEAEYIRKDGSTYWTETRASFIRDGAGKVVGILGVTRDIDARKQAEEALKASEAQYHLLAEHMTDIVWMMNMDLNVTWLSLSAVKARGFSMDEITALPLDRQLTPKSLEKAVNWLGKLMRLEKDGRNPEPDGMLSR
jgi:PAS domain-containing protein